MSKQTLRVVGGPHDGAVYDADDTTLAVQMGDVPTDASVSQNGEIPVGTINVAVYCRRAIQFEDGATVSFLCFNDWTDRQALCHLLKVPYEP